MPILRSSPASPFGRKVKIAASLVGLDGSYRIENADTTNPSDSLRQQNPLGKIPVMVLDDGTAIYDSRVIIEYLDLQAGGGQLIPQAAGPRIAALRLQALADGLMDAAILQVYEIRMRPEDRRSADWVAYQADKVTRGLAALEASPPELEPMTVGTVAVACALGYLDLRFEGRWRAAHPRLVAFLEAFAARVPKFEATRFVP